MTNTPFAPSPLLMEPEPKSEAELAILKRPPPDITEYHNRTTCRWCLEPFDPTLAKDRTIWERGRLRTNLMMHDNGNELVICDNCWAGAFGYKQRIMHQQVPCDDPTVIPNPLLRGL